MATITNYINLQGNMAGGLRTIASNANTAQQGLSGLAYGAKGVGGAFSALKPTMAMTGAMFAGSVLAAGVTAAASAVMALQGDLMDTAAEYVGIKARLGLIAGSQQNVAALNDMIYQSAQRARGGYLDMAQAVSQLTLNARDAFPDPREAVSFIEGTQKLFVVGGASKENQKNAMLQLTQAMASGWLQGDGFRSISENAPMIQNILAKSMGVSRGQLKQLASEGKITADVIKTAIIGNMAEINAQFEAMPKKWGDHFTDLKNVATRAFVPIYDDISTLANSQGVKQFISGAKTGIVFLSNLIRKMATGFGQFMAVAKPGILVLGDTIKSFANGMGELFPEVPQLKPIPDQKVKLVSEQTTSGQNPSPAKPKDNGIQRLIAGAKVGAAVVAKAIGGIVTGIGYLLSGITKAGAYIASWIGGAFTVAAKLAAGFFGIISAGFPVVLGLVAGLATVWAICNAQQAYSIALAKAQAVWDAVVSAGMVARRTALGIVAGAMFAWNVITAGNITMQSILAFVTGLVTGNVLVLAAIIVGVLVAAYVIWTSAGMTLADGIAGAMDFIIDATEMAVNACIKLINGLITVLNAAAGGINSVFGTHIGKIGLVGEVNFQGAKQWSEAVRQGNFMEKMKTTFGDTFGDLFKLPDMSKSGDWSGGVGDQIAANTGDTAGNTKGIKDALDSSADDLRFLKEAAEREAINKYTTATIHIDAGGMQVYNNERRDFDGMLRRFADVVQEAAVAGAEAVKA